MMINFLKKLPVAKKDAILLTLSGIFIILSLLTKNNLSQLITIIIGSIAIFRGLYKWITSPKIKKQVDNPIFK